MSSKVAPSMKVNGWVRESSVWIHGTIVYNTHMNFVDLYGNVIYWVNIMVYLLYHQFSCFLVNM